MNLKWIGICGLASASFVVAAGALGLMQGPQWVDGAANVSALQPMSHDALETEARSSAQLEAGGVQAEGALTAAGLFENPYDDLLAAAIDEEQPGPFDAEPLEDYGFCNDGIRTTNKVGTKYCCKASCKFNLCMNVGCKNRGPEAHCCPYKIAQSNKFCGTAPCILYSGL